MSCLPDPRLTFPLVPVSQMASWILQSASKNSWPMYNANLNGSGQIVQVADTGLDQRSCFFRDQTGNVPTTTYLAAAFDLTRRKVVQYVVWADSTDVNGGHGTHVSGRRRRCLFGHVWGGRGDGKGGRGGLWEGLGHTFYDGLMCILAWCRARIV